MGASGAINLCIGSYDGKVIGLGLETESDGLLALQANFAQPTHTGAVRAIALDGPTLLTGGADETIRVYDVAKRVESGCLFQHSGTVSTARIFRDSRSAYALTGGHDMSLCIWRTRDWRCLKRLHGHMAPILDVGVHPSARLALSTSRDRAVLMWSLVKGKAVFSAKVKNESATRVEWAPDGRHYLLAAGNAVTVSDVEGRQTSAFMHEKMVSDAAFVTNVSVATGSEDKVVRIWDARSGKAERIGPTHDYRVQSVSSVGDFIISADSRGGIKVWDITSGDQARLETCVGGGDMLLTCMTASWAEAQLNVEAVAAKRNRRRKKGAATAANATAGGGGEAREDWKAKNAGTEKDVPSKPKRKRRKKKNNTEVEDFS